MHSRPLAGARMHKLASRKIGTVAVTLREFSRKIILMVIKFVEPYLITLNLLHANPNPRNKMQRL